MEKIEDVILFQIDQASRQAKQYSQRELDRLGVGVTVEQWILLKIVSENAGLNQKDLAQKSLRDPASITRTLDLLEKKGLVNRLPIPNTRRAYEVKLSAEGDAFIAEHMKTITKHRKLSTKGFKKEELELLSDMLKRIQNNFK